MAEAKPIGEVTHYFDKIMVAIVKAKKAVKKGDTLKFKTNKGEFDQVVESMQIDHQDVESAKSGSEFGVKVQEEVDKGDEVFTA